MYLKTELRILTAREAAIKEKELLLSETQASFDRLIAAEAHNRLVEKDRVSNSFLECIKH